MEPLFVYGTLQDPEVQLRVIGRLVAGESDALPGYRASTVRIGDGEYRAAVPSPSDSIPGLVLELSAEELARTDAYETAQYARIRVRLESGRESWVYAAALPG